MKGSTSHSITLAIALAFACAIACFISVDSTLWGWIAARIYVIPVTLMPGILLGLSCIGWGSLLLWKARQTDLCTPMELMLTAFGCGVGIVSSGAFLLGMTGTMNQLSSNALLFAGVLLGLPFWKQAIAMILARNRLEKESVSLGAVVAGALFLVIVLCIGMVSLTPPLIFDVTEYHLGAWTDYHSAGIAGAQFVPMPYNFFARFPFAIESIYFLGLSAAPFLDSAPKVFNAICVIMCGLLAAAIAKRLGAGRAGSYLAALVAVAHPVMLDVSLDALIDAPIALLIGVSVLAGLIIPDRRNVGADPPTGLMIPACFTFATALASKYTVAQIYLLPWLVFVLPSLLRNNWRRPGLLAAAVVFSAIPCFLWFGKNLLFYGNPLEPFFVKLFQPGDSVGIFSETLCVASHGPQSPATAAYWISLVPRLRDFEWLLLVPCVGWIFRDRRAEVLRILGITIVVWLCWNTVRESQDRFLLPAIVLLSAVAATGALSFPTRALRRFVAGLLVLFVLAQWTHYALTMHGSGVVDYVINFSPGNRRTLAESEQPSPREKFYETNLGDLGRMINQTNRALPDNAQLLLLYEARSYLFRNDTRYNVIWDESVLLDIIRNAGSTEQAWSLLRKAGITHILVNRQELLRYIQLYPQESQLQRFGIQPGMNPRLAWSQTAHPEDLYLPFYRDADWERLRPIVHQLLQEIDDKAALREGAAQTAPGVKRLDITLTPL